VDLATLAGAFLIAAASFAPQFRYNYYADLSGGCSAWSRCLGDPIGAEPDITSIERWLVVAGLVVAIVPMVIGLLRPRTDRRRLALFQAVSAWAVFIGVVALLVWPDWQERGTAVYESNRTLLLMPGWGLGLVLVGLVLVLTAAAKRWSRADVETGRGRGRPEGATRIHGVASL
jgi:hypothetical protein